MEDQEISNLPEADPLSGSEIIAITQSGETKRTTLTSAAALMAAATTVQNWQSPFRGAILKITSDKTGLTFPTFIGWDTTNYDTDGFWSVGNSTRITIPAGISKVRFNVSVRFNTAAESGTLFVAITKNGLTSEAGYSNAIMSVRSGTTGFGNNTYMGFTPVIDVEDGDYFEVRITKSGMASVDEILTGSNTFFGVEVVEATDAEARPYDLTGTVLGTPSVSSIVDQHVMSRSTRILENGDLLSSTRTPPRLQTLISMCRKTASQSGL